MPNERQLEKIIRVAGREFRIYREYDNLLGQDILIYPDFTDGSQYTNNGRPFMRQVDESCPYGKSGNPETPDPGDCGGCVFFHRESTPCDPIGICMCDARQQRSRAKKEEAR